jgi:tetratricopeptide (TPR) repeat protein
MGEEERESLHSISIEGEASMAKRSIYGHKHPIDDRLVDVMPQEPLLYPPEYIVDDLEGTPMVNSMERSPDTLPKRAVDAIALLEHSPNNLGPEHPNTMTYLENVAEVFWQQGRLRELEPFLNELLDLKQKQLGPKNVSTLASMDTKGRILYQSQRYAEAEEQQTEVVQIRKQIWGMENPHTLNSMYLLVRTYTALEKFDESEELALQLIEHAKRSPGENDPFTLISIRARAFNSLRRGDYKKGEELLLHIVEVSEKHQDYPALREAGKLAAIDLAGAYFDNGEPQRAEEMLDKILMSLRTGAGTDDARNRLSITGQIADVYLAHGRLDNAEKLFKEALKNAAQLYGLLNNHRAYCGAQLARVFYQKGKIVEARELMAECADDLLKLLGPQFPDTADAFKDLKEWEVSVESKYADK